jgi:hypothetical protein
MTAPPAPVGDGSGERRLRERMQGKTFQLYDKGARAALSPEIGPQDRRAAVTPDRVTLSTRDASRARAAGRRP